MKGTGNDVFNSPLRNYRFSNANVMSESQQVSLKGPGVCIIITQIFQKKCFGSAYGMDFGQSVLDKFRRGHVSIFGIWQLHARLKSSHETGKHLIGN